MNRHSVDGTFNTRSFGGAAPWLVRSGSLDHLDESGLAALRELGVTRVIDLREPSERRATGEVAAAHPHPAAALPTVSVPLYRLPDGPPTHGSLEAVYEMLVTERSGALAEAVGAVADAVAADDGAVLVHCTAGKDRTGLVVALVLLAAGASESDVIDDYAASERDVAEHRARDVEIILAALGLDPADEAEARRLHLTSPADALRHALRIVDAHGGPHAYLLHNGVTVDQLLVLRDRARGRTTGVERGAGSDDDVDVEDAA